MSGLSELGRHNGVHADHDFFLFSHNSISLFDLFRDPFLEILSDDGCAHVHNPLLRDLGQVGIVWQVVFNIRMSADEFHYSFDRQVFVLRHMQMLDGVIVQICLLSAKDIFQKVDRSIVYRIQKY